MINLDEQLRTGLSLLAEKKGNVYTLSKEFDVAHTTLAAWISGKTSKVKTSVFIKILQLLRDHSILSSDACAEYGKKEGLIIPTTNKSVKTERIEMTAQPLSAEGVIIAAINGELEGLSLGELREVLRNILNMKRGNEIRKEVKYGNDHRQRGSNAPLYKRRDNPSSDT